MANAKGSNFVCFFDNVHTDENFAEMIFNEILQFELNDKIFTLTVDSVSNSNVAVEFCMLLFHYHFPVQEIFSC